MVRYSFLISGRARNTFSLRMMSPYISMGKCPRQTDCLSVCNCQGNGDLEQIGCLREIEKAAVAASHLVHFSAC